MPNATGSTVYDENFYIEQMAGSYSSAQIYADRLLTFFNPGRVADVGCGRGTWLKAFSEQGAHTVVGFDGSWNSHQNMVVNQIEFIPCDLNSKLRYEGQRFDLALSLEVAEHVEEASSDTFVENLVGLADVVLFSAAYSGQGGTSHVNEQPHSYWAAKFAASGYDVFDAFRPVFWGNEHIDYWYRQNAFLYAKRNTASAVQLSAAGLQPMENIEFMNCVHPVMLQAQTTYLSTRKFLRDRLRKKLQNAIKFGKP